MKWIGLFLVLTMSYADACTITISIQTTAPPQSLSKTWNETDANCVLALQAIVAQNYPGAQTPAQAALWWAQNAVSYLVSITTQYQRANAPITPINPQ